MADLLALKRRVVLAPQDPDARFELAEALFLAKDLDRARTQLERCLDSCPAHPNALRLFARVLRGQGEPAASRRALQRLVDSAPSDAGPRESLAEAYLADDRLDDALLWLLEANRLPPPSPQRALRCAELAAGTRRPALARAVLERALEAWPEDAGLGAARRALLAGLGVEDAFDLLASLEPGDPLAGAREALLREDLGAARRALVEGAADPRPELHLLRGELLLLSGEPDRAARSFEAARAASRRALACGALAGAVRSGTVRRMGVLGWSVHGGAVSPLEAVAVPGRGELHFSGNVRGSGLDAGRVAHSFLKAHGEALGVARATRERDLHLNFTDAELGKEGLSSGLALSLAGLCAYRGARLRPRLAATGALTLSGEVQRVDGIHEKLVAAFLDGVRRVLLPRGNRADAEALPAPVRAGLELRHVASFEDALPHAVG